MPQIIRSPQTFDVVVVGSGAGGGTAVKVLTDLGLTIALLEAGPMLNPAKDFKEHVLPYQVDHRGAGPHAEMSAWYAKAEGFIGVTGTKEGLRTAPDGNFLPAIPPRVHELLIQKACKKLNIPCIPSRMAMLTKSLNGRAACHYCGQCGRGCQTASAFSSSQAMIFPAMKTVKLTSFTGAMARELLADRSGRVTAVSFVDKSTRTERQIRCRV